MARGFDVPFVDSISEKCIYREIQRFSSTESVQESVQRTVIQNVRDNSGLIIKITRQGSSNAVVLYSTESGRVVDPDSHREDLDFHQPRERWFTVSEIVKTVRREEPAARAAVTESSRSHHESAITRARRLDERGQTDSALDLIYDSLEEMIQTEQISALDQALSAVDVRDLSLDLLIGILTATLPARGRSAERRDFFRRVERVLRERGELVSRLLTGLD